jgi:hypothetical protein
MTAVEIYQDRAPAVIDHRTAAVQSLAEWAQSAQAAMVVAEQLSRSSFVPEQFRGKPAEATAAILAGLEVGLQPMAALRSFDIINGTAAPRALTLRAVLLAHGHEIELTESTASRCKMRGRRAGSTAWQTVDWTLDRAKTLNLTGKDSWRKQPQAMLVARATSELARLVAADAILGIGYSAEEIADGAGAGVEVPTATTAEQTPSGTKRMSRRKVEPPPDEMPAEPEQVKDATPPLTEAQKKKLHALLGALDVHDRDDRLSLCSNIVGHPLASSADLTKDEASTVIDTLSKVEAGAAEIVFDDGQLRISQPEDVTADELELQSPE